MSAQAQSARADDDLRPARRSGRRSGAAASGPKYSGEGDQPFRLIVISEYACPGDQHAPVILERSPEPQIRRNASSPATRAFTSIVADLTCLLLMVCTPTGIR
jgi:hypothetical protein